MDSNKLKGFCKPQTTHEKLASQKDLEEGTAGAFKRPGITNLQEKANSTTRIFCSSKNDRDKKDRR